MAFALPVVDTASLAAWCSVHLGSPAERELFQAGHLTRVIGTRLADGREVVVRVRPASPRIAACAEVQRRVFDSEYPCPQPLAGPALLGEYAATAESYISGGTTLPDSGRAAQPFAEALAQLVRLAPPPEHVPSLAPAPAWAAWNHSQGGLWPRPEDLEVDLNDVDGPGLYPAPATVAETREFLDAYATARGRPFSPGELQGCWAAGVWTRAFDAKQQHAAAQPITLLSQDEAHERLRQAGVR